MIVTSSPRPVGSVTLGRYVDASGRRREVVTCRGFGDSLLLIDRDADTLGDCRLVAHLGADEPPRNATLVCGEYLRAAGTGAGRCRPLTPDDLRRDPFPEDVDAGHEARLRGASSRLEAQGSVLRLLALQTGMAIPELRWCRCTDEGHAAIQPLSVREAIASLQSYEPVRGLTHRALRQACAGELSTTVLKAELVRLLESPIVLNRRLREVALALIERNGLTLSEIAMRCGRLKRDVAGHVTGETSWLARRLGILPEGGKEAPTPWIHSDVLALIARRGLGVSPREVEAG